MIRDNIRKVRIAKKVSGERIADALGVTRPAYTGKELARYPIDVEELPVIAEVLGEKPAVFFDDALTDAVVEKLGRDA